MLVNPSDYLVYYNMANTYAELKNFPKALHYYSRTLDFNSQEPEIYNAIALLYHDFEDYVESRAYYEKALSIDSNNFFSIVSIESCYSVFNSIEVNLLDNCYNNSVYCF
jgi:tetratricopeptide (TPR) repeat protein